MWECDECAPWRKNTSSDEAQLSICYECMCAWMGSVEDDRYSGWGGGGGGTGGKGCEGYNGQSHGSPSSTSSFPFFALYPQSKHDKWEPSLAWLKMKTRIHLQRKRGGKSRMGGKKIIRGREKEMERAIKGGHVKSREKDRGRQKQGKAAAIVSFVAYFFCSFNIFMNGLSLLQNLYKPLPYPLHNVKSYSV